MVVVNSAVALVAAVLAIASPVSANLVKDEAELPKEYLSLAPGYAIPANQSEFGADIFQGELPNPINENPLNHINLFRRQAGAKCTFYRSGDARTCVTADNKCCIDPNNAQDGWCCAPTAGCGPGTGTLGKCTTNINWSTSYVYETSTTTRYSTIFTSIATSTETTTRVWTDVEVVTRSDIDTATDWVTVTVTQAAAKAKRTAAQTPAVPYHSSAAPAYTTKVPAATPAVEQQQVELRAAVTNAPRVFVIEGKLYKRQVLRTDTSTWYTTSTVWTTDMVTITSGSNYVATTTSYSTTTSTRTFALNAKTTVTETLTQTVQPGETVPINPVSPVETGPGGEIGGGTGGGGGRRGGSSGGLSTGAKAGIGGGVGAGILAIIAVVGICFARRKKKQNNTTPTNPSTFAPGGGPAMAGAGTLPPSTLSSPAPVHAAAGHYGQESKTPYSNASVVPSNPPHSPPPQQSDRYSHMSQPPMGVGVGGGYPNAANGTPSPQPQYAYPQSGYSEMSATPVSYNSQPQMAHPQPSVSPQQGGGYAYPRPASPGSPQQQQGYPQQQQQNYGYGGGYGGNQYASHGGQPQEIYSQYQAPPQEMPTGEHSAQGGAPKP